MLKLLGLLAIAVVVAIAGILVWAATRPDDFRVERRADIKAPPEKIFAEINDFHNWVNWSPYEKWDPAMTRNLSGAASGKGAIYEWQGTGKVGQGRMEVLDASASKVIIKLDFVKPFPGHNIAEFTMVPAGVPAGDMTTVTWAMSGPSPYIAKVMGIFFNMDKMIGGDFEAGLANLKAVAEK